MNAFNEHIQQILDEHTIAVIKGGIRYITPEYEKRYWQSDKSIGNRSGEILGNQILQTMRQPPPKPDGRTLDEKLCDYFSPKNRRG